MSGKKTRASLLFELLEILIKSDGEAPTGNLNTCELGKSSRGGDQGLCQGGLFDMMCSSVNGMPLGNHVVLFDSSHVE